MAFADHTEKVIAEALALRGIKFRHESEGGTNGLDFYLPDFDIYIEVKRFHSPRISSQMSAAKNIIAIQGVGAVNAFIALISG